MSVDESLSSPTEAVVAFTIKPRQADLGDSEVYQELLCFSTTPQQEWPYAEEVLLVPRKRIVLLHIHENYHNFSQTSNL